MVENLIQQSKPQEFPTTFNIYNKTYIMALLDKFNNQQTNLHPYDGRQPGTPTNPGATKQSRLHAFGNIPGYSLNGSFFPQVNNASNNYDNGSPKTFPLDQPSNLDLNGVEPKSALKYPGTFSINNTFSKGKYEDYVLQTKVFQDRVDDITG